MIDFKEITLADKQWMQPLIQMSGYATQEYNFNFMYIWRRIFNYKAARAGDFLLLRAEFPGWPPSYLFPPGSGDIKPVVEALIQHAGQEGGPLVFHVVLPEQVKLLETLFPDRFSVTPVNEDYYDYVYDAQSMITLAGKKLHAKRNHINRFKQDNPDWRYEVITPEQIEEISRMNVEWCRVNECESTRSGHEEACVCRCALENYAALGMQGGLIRVGGKVVAFSLGEPLNHDTYLVHFEKAFSEVQGAYAIINQQFAFHNCQDFLYINREDDSGQPGLRKAKESYRPVFKTEKYAARLKSH